VTENLLNLDGLDYSFDKSSLIDNEPDSECIEWYMLEGSERLFELSRQLRTIINYRSNITRLRFSKTYKHDYNKKNNSILNREKELLSLYRQYANIFSGAGLEQETIEQKIRNIINKVKILPNSLEKNILKDIKNIGKEIWKKLHALSEFELYFHPYLLLMSIKIASILSSTEKVFYSLFSNFYNELKTNYLQLEKELSELLRINEKEIFKERERLSEMKLLE
jgi:hypothetical protein